jgi:hypothetical protein
LLDSLQVFFNFFLRRALYVLGRVVHGARCPWGEMSVGRVVRGVSCPWGEMFVGRDVRGANCHGASCPGASCRGASRLGASGPGTKPQDVNMDQTGMRKSNILLRQFSKRAVRLQKRCLVFFTVCICHHGSRVHWQGIQEVHFMFRRFIKDV